MESKGEFEDPELSMVSDLFLCINVRFPLVEVVDPVDPSVLHDKGVTAVAGGIVRGVNLFKWLFTSVRWTDPSTLFAGTPLPAFIPFPPLPFKIKRPPPV